MLRGWTFAVLIFGLVVLQACEDPRVGELNEEVQALAQERDSLATQVAKLSEAVDALRADLDRPTPTPVPTAAPKLNPTPLSTSTSQPTPGPTVTPPPQPTPTSGPTSTPLLIPSPIQKPIATAIPLSGWCVHSPDGSAVACAAGFDSYELSRDGTSVACGGRYDGYAYNLDGSDVCCGGLYDSPLCQHKVRHFARAN